jgi:hypothetical protein
MTLYHGGENDIEFVSYRPTLRDSSPTPHDANLEEMLMVHHNIAQAPFIDLVVFKRICMMCFRSLVEGT